MSVVGLSSRGLHIGNGGGHGAAASAAAATIRRNYYCHECNRTVSIIDNNELICSNCNGVVLEELDSTVTFTPSSSSSPLTAVFGSISLHDYFTSAASDTDTDSDIELSLPLPPPPLPPFLSADDPALHNYDVDNIDFSEPFPLSSSPPPLSNLRSRAIISGLEIDFSEPLGPYHGDNYMINPPPPRPPPFTRIRRRAPLPPPSPPPPPPPLSNLRSRAIISGLEIDFSEPLCPYHGDNYMIHPPPPPPPAFTRIRRLAPLPPPSPPPRIHTLHRLPPPPSPRPGPAPRMPITIPTSTTAREIQLPYPLPPPPPPSPPSSSTWDYFFPPSEEGPDNIDRASGTGRAKELVEEKFIFDRKMSKELMESEDSWQCAVCLDNLELDQVVKRMPCKHIYHSRCIMPWLESHQTCPVCRYELSWNCITDC